MKSENTGGIRILESDVIVRDHWLGLIRRHFLDRLGKPGSWTFVERNGDRKAVLIAACHTPSQKLILIRQFRIPLSAWVYEFPAGLMDEGESPAASALRELAEETGYTGTVTHLSPVLPSTPGLCSELIYFVEVECTGEPQAHAREASEAIELVMLDDKKEAIQTFLNRAEEERAFVDAKLYTWLKSRI